MFSYLLSTSSADDLQPLSHPRLPMMTAYNEAEVLWANVKHIPNNVNYSNSAPVLNIEL